MTIEHSSEINLSVGYHHMMENILDDAKQGLEEALMELDKTKLMTSKLQQEIAFIVSECLEKLKEVHIEEAEPIHLLLKKENIIEA